MIYVGIHATLHVRIYPATWSHRASTSKFHKILRMKIVYNIYNMYTTYTTIVYDVVLNSKLISDMCSYKFHHFQNDCFLNVDFKIHFRERTIYVGIHATSHEMIYPV